MNITIKDLHLYLPAILYKGIDEAFLADLEDSVNMTLDVTTNNTKRKFLLKIKTIINNTRKIPYRPHEYFYGAVNKLNKQYTHLFAKDAVNL
jgi:hypothetical protein